MSPEMWLVLAGGIVMTAINYGLLLRHLHDVRQHTIYLNKRLQGVKDENAALRQQRNDLEARLADTQIKLEIAIIENASLSGRIERQNSAG